MRRPTRCFRPVLECLENRLTPSSFTATIKGTTLTITEAKPDHGSSLVIAPAATFGDVSITSNAGDTITGNAITNPSPVTTVVVNLGTSGIVANGGTADTLTFDGSSTNGLNFSGGLSINGTGGDKVLALTDVNLLGDAPLMVNLMGNGAETSTFTNVNVGGAATIMHSGVGNTQFTITSTAAAPGPYNWGSLSITNGQGADTNVINDTNFAGNVNINNGKGDGTTTGDTSTKLSAANDQTLTTIGGNLTINTMSGISDSEVDDYNVHGTVMINTGTGITGQTTGSIVDLESTQTVATSGIPTIGGNVTITATTVADLSPGLTIAVGTSSNPTIMHGNLSITATGTGVSANNGPASSVGISLTNLRIASGAASITLAGQTSGDTVSVNGTSGLSEYPVSDYGSLSITSNATGANTYNIQNQAGETDVDNTVSLQLTNPSAIGADAVQIGDTNQAPPPNEDGTVNIDGNLNITGTGSKSITAQGLRLSGTGANEGNLNVTLTGPPPAGGLPFSMAATFTDTSITGAATVSDSTYSDCQLTITSAAAGTPDPNTVFKWGSLSVTNGKSASVQINDTDFAGNVSITNATTSNVATPTFLRALNDENLMTIGGNLSITNTGSGASDTEVYDYSVQGNVTIKSAAAANDFVGLENVQTYSTSGIPVIGGNVTITAGSGAASGNTAAIDVGTGGGDGAANPAPNNPIFIAGNLGITTTGGGVTVDLDDVVAPDGTTTVMLGTGTGDTVNVEGTTVTSVFNNFTLTSSATGANTFNIQAVTGTTEFGGTVNVTLAGGANTLTIASDTNNDAIVDLYGSSASTFNGGTGNTSTLVGGLPNADLHFIVTPKFEHFA